MASLVLAEVAITMSDPERYPSLALDAGQGRTVAITNRNRPKFYVVPAAVWERIDDLLDDIDLNALCDARTDEVGVPVSLSSL